MLNVKIMLVNGQKIAIKFQLRQWILNLDYTTNLKTIDTIYHGHLCYFQEAGSNKMALAMLAYSALEFRTQT